MKNIFAFFPAWLICFVLLLFGGSFAFGQTLEWVKQVGRQDSPGKDEGGLAITVDNLGNVYTVGYFNGKVDFDPGPDSYFLTAAIKHQLFIQKLDSSGNFLWAKQMGDYHHKPYSSAELEFSISTDVFGNIYLAGPLYVSHRDVDIFLIKLNPSGVRLWTKNSGIIDDTDFFHGLALDKSGNSYMTWQIVNLSDAFVIEKRNPAGSIIWEKKIRANQDVYSQALAVDKDENVYLTGYFVGNVDFAPGFDVQYLAGDYNNTFIQKLNIDGDLVWAKGMGGIGMNEGQAIACDGFGNVYVGGYFKGEMDFDPGEGELFLTPQGTQDAFIQRFDSSGNLIWVKQFKGKDFGIEVDLITTDKFGNVYAAGAFGDDTDFDTGLGTHILIPDKQGTTFMGDVFIHKMDSTGNFLWAKGLGLESMARGRFGYTDGLTGLFVDSFGHVYSTGEFESIVDFDPSDQVYNLISYSAATDVFISKWSQTACDNMALVFDRYSIHTCTMEGASAAAHVTNGKPPYTYSWNTQPATKDSMATFFQGGIYSLTVGDSIGCSKKASVWIDHPPTFQNNYDLYTNLIASDFRSGFPTSIWIDAFNYGCEPVSGQIVLVLSPNVEFDWAFLPPDDIQGDSLIWNYSDLTYDSGHIKIEVFLKTKLGLTLNDQVCFNLTMNPSDNPLVSKDNNVKDYCFPVIGSYDPNDIKVYPVGECEAGYIEPDQPLTYTVRFQNTGNADAINVFILDELDKNLDLKTLRILGQSHEPMIPEILNGNVLKFRFDNIHLPDSNANEPESHGYVVFQVSPFPGLAPGTLIENQVGIYFDFNDPVLTNTVSNRILDTLDTQVEVIENHLTAYQDDATYQWMDCKTDLPIDGATNRTYIADRNGEYYVIVTRYGCSDSSECHSISTGEFGSSMRFFPVPAQETLNIDLGEIIPEGTVELFSLSGQVLSRQSIENQESMELDISRIPSGVFFVQIVSQGRWATFKVMKE